MNRASKLILILAVSTMTAACVSQKEEMIKEGYPRAYADGFEDGCTSGKNAGGNMFEHFKKDVRRFGKDKDYSQGWSDAFRQCETAEEASQRQYRMAVEQQKLNEQKRHDKEMENHPLTVQDLGIKYDADELNKLGK